MKVKPFKEEVMELVLKFLQNDMNEPEIANRLRQKHIKDIPSWVLLNNELVKKGLAKVVKAYVQMDKKIKKYYVERKQPAEQADEESQEEIKEVVKKIKPSRKVSTNSVAESEKVTKKVEKLAPAVEKAHHENTSTWVKNKFEPPKKLEQIGKDDEPVKILKPLNKKAFAMVSKQASSEESSDRPLHSDHSESEEKVKKPKKAEPKKVQKPVEIKPKKSKKPETSSEQSSQQSVQVKKPVIKEKKVVKKQKKQEKESEAKKQTKREKSQEKTHKMHTRLDDKMEEQNNEAFHKNSNENKKVHVSTFSRIKIDQVGPIPVKLQDNSFQAKFKYGQGGDEWGRYGHERLKDTRGESFKKTKDKLKNKAFQGSNIDFNVINSIPID